MYANSMWEDFKHRLLSGDDMLVKLILINVVVFFLINLIHVALLLSGTGISFGYLANQWFALPPEIFSTLIRPWTYITYQFMHAGLFHILFNMIVLYWSGRIFQEYLGNHRLLSLYILGGISGGLLFLVAYLVFPYLQAMRPELGLVGASASVLAVLVAIGTYLPNYTVHLIFFGGVRLKYIILAVIAIDLISLSGANAGGHFAHLGGALFGFVFTHQLKNGRDLSAAPSRLIAAITDRLQGLFSRSGRSFTVHRTKPATNGTSAEPNQEEIDRILDKIASSGYKSLTEAEKEILFKASNKK